jgi:hypothetical protein
LLSESEDQNGGQNNGFIGPINLGRDHLLSSLHFEHRLERVEPLIRSPLTLLIERLRKYLQLQALTVLRVAIIEGIHGTSPVLTEFLSKALAQRLNRMVKFLSFCKYFNQ